MLVFLKSIKGWTYLGMLTLSTCSGLIGSQWLGQVGQVFQKCPGKAPVKFQLLVGYFGKAPGYVWQIFQKLLKSRRRP